MTWKLPFVAGLAILSLAGLDWWLVRNRVDISPIKPGRVSLSETSSQTSADAGTAVFGDLSETLERPLFSPTRRKYQPPLAEETAPPDAPTPVEVPAQPAPVVAAPKLLGVTINGDEVAALLQSPSTPNPAWHRMGAGVDGWTITEIDSNSVTFSNGYNREVRTLYDMGESLAR